MKLTCGSAIVRGHERRVEAKLRLLGEEKGVKIEIAEDGMEHVVP